MSLYTFQNTVNMFVEKQDKTTEISASFFDNNFAENHLLSKKSKVVF